jgi:hypothetical protein
LKNVYSLKLLNEKAEGICGVLAWDCFHSFLPSFPIIFQLEKKKKKKKSQFEPLSCPAREIWLNLEFRVKNPSQ